MDFKMLPFFSRKKSSRVSIGQYGSKTMSSKQEVTSVHLFRFSHVEDRLEAFMLEEQGWAKNTLRADHI